MKRKKEKLLIYLIDASNAYVHGVERELDGDACVKVFSSFDECSRALHKKPSVIIMDNIKDAFVKSRIKSRLDELPFAVKLIFLSPQGVAEDIQPQVTHDDYVVKDADLYDKLHLAVDEFAFSYNYEEKFEGEALSVGASSFKLTDLLLPICVVTIASIIFALSI